MPKLFAFRIWSGIIIRMYTDHGGECNVTRIFATRLQNIEYWMGNTTHWLSSVVARPQLSLSQRSGMEIRLPSTVDGDSMISEGRGLVHETCPEPSFCSDTLQY